MLGSVPVVEFYWGYRLSRMYLYVLSGKGKGEGNGMGYIV